MKYKIFSELVLIAASILRIFVIGVIVFAGGSFIEGIGKSGMRSINVVDFLSLLSLLLFIISVIIAWFKRFIGSLLMTFFAIAHILLDYEHEIAWLQISILFIGPLLFIFVRSNRGILNKEKSNS